MIKCVEGHLDAERSSITPQKEKHLFKPYKYEALSPFSVFSLWKHFLLLLADTENTSPKHTKLKYSKLFQCIAPPATNWHK